MPELRQQLQECLRGRVCLFGLGNPARGDDGLGVRLAEALSGRVPGARVVVAGTSPERHLDEALQGEPDHLLFLDAVDLGADPGAVALLDSEGMQTRFPQISTHRLSLGLLARWVEAAGRTRAWLLGVQPASLREGEGLSLTVRTSLNLLCDLVCRP